MLNKNQVAFYKTSIDDREYIYKYYVLETSKEMAINNKKYIIPCYGICIVSEVYENGNMCFSFEDSIEHLTPLLSKVLNLVEYLKNNGVSPVHLIDIAGEFVDEWVNDFDEKAYNMIGEISVAI
ncbi:hypothetical protein FDN13_12360 [Caloramator sp. E03]|uniref:DUF6514 family protein n=1 Tax=Caloramator sp. E03 TaxID=2576307 RepID=UPI001110D7E5|nr:DUF6514 family protein [Caloramator sp. E03]QCX34427.1 hypothetical protein FDN13_12360 [Caloramator sp. E03]